MVLGIDPGKDGGIVIIDNNSIVFKHTIPSTLAELNEIFIKIDCAFDVKIAVLEDVHSLPGMSAKSNFSFGWIKGVKEAFLQCYFWEYDMVQPKNWQKVVWEPEDVILKENGRKDTKQTSLNAAKRIWPNEDWTKSKRATKPHDGLIDAALIAYYGYLKHKDGPQSKT